MNACDPAEIAAYAVVRQRLRALAVTHPWLLEVSIAVQGRPCLSCARHTCIEHPADQFRCTACGATWTQADLARKYRPSAHRGTV